MFTINLKCNDELNIKQIIFIILKIILQIFATLAVSSSTTEK